MEAEGMEDDDENLARSFPDADWIALDGRRKRKRDRHELHADFSISFDGGAVAGEFTHYSVNCIHNVNTRPSHLNAITTQGSWAECPVHFQSRN